MYHTPRSEAGVVVHDSRPGLDPAFRFLCLEKLPPQEGLLEDLDLLPASAAPSYRWLPEQRHKRGFRARIQGETGYRAEAAENNLSWAKTDLKYKSQCEAQGQGRTQICKPQPTAGKITSKRRRNNMNNRPRGPKTSAQSQTSTRTVETSTQHTLLKRAHVDGKQ